MQGPAVSELLSSPLRCAQEIRRAEVHATVAGTMSVKHSCFLERVQQVKALIVGGDEKTIGSEIFETFQSTKHIRASRCCVAPPFPSGHGR